ncbi:MAG: metal ABC transporter permease [Segniliparus sp.]|uniref:metal ABC transporter permease n=1 Tax=Segniliparus sp. TaxID=2804064 RepID=UPI003F2A1D6C
MSSADFFDWGLTMELLDYGPTRRAVLAAAVLGLLSAALGPLIVRRRMSFAVHATSELAVTGAAVALFFGASVQAGSMLGAIAAGLVFGILGLRAADRDIAYAVVLSFGLGVSVLLLNLREGAATNLSALLTGGLASVGEDDLWLMAATVAVVCLVVAWAGRPLWFASVDPAAAAAKGVPARFLAVGFTVLVAAAAAIGMQVVGALLVLALMVAPAASAARLTSSRRLGALLTLVFAQAAAVGGVLLSLAPSWPPSALITAICFFVYVGARAADHFRSRRF